MENKTVAIIQSNYIPWKGYFDLIKQSDVLIIYDEVQYTKNDWRNRNMIKTPNGKQWLTIPVKQNSLDQKIHETVIADTSWSKKHMNALQINYSKTPFFKTYKELFFELYTHSSEYLSEINLSFIKAICGILEINTQIIDSRELNLDGDKNMKLVNACLKLNATNYLSGPAAKSYLDIELFNQNNIKVDWMDYSKYNEYPQLHPPFAHDVSVLDMVFNTGKWTI